MDEKPKNKVPSQNSNMALKLRLKNLYSKALRNYYITAFLGFMIGAQLCDMVFYDPIKN